MFADASFATDITDSKSTTGGFLVLIGPNSLVPITWLCKKQGAVSHSSTEAEIVALDAAIRMEGVPCLDLLTHIQGTLTPTKRLSQHKPVKTMRSATPQHDPEIQILTNVDYVPPHGKYLPIQQNSSS